MGVKRLVEVSVNLSDGTTWRAALLRSDNDNEERYEVQYADWELNGYYTSREFENQIEARMFWATISNRIQGFLWAELNEGLFMKGLH